MNKKLLAIFLIACLTSSCFLTSCSKDTEAEPLEEAVEETVEEAVEETPETEEEAEIATTPEEQLTEGDTSGADSTGVDGEFEEGEYRGDEEEDDLDLQALIDEILANENTSTPSSGGIGYHNTPEGDAFLEQFGTPSNPANDEEIIFGQGDYSKYVGVVVE